MDILKCFLAGCGVVFVVGLAYQIFLCCAYDEWRQDYIPVSNALKESIRRVTLLGNIIDGMTKPTLADIREYTDEFFKMKRLAAEADRIWKLNPRRVNGERPATFIDTVKRYLHKKK